jgi:peptidoglycan hydrolase-like protein with peptidoglycan-binding domain
MKTKTIESLQRWLKAKRFNPGAIDSIDGPNTFDARSAYLAANGASNTKEELHAN